MNSILPEVPAFPNKGDINLGLLGGVTADF